MHAQDADLEDPGGGGQRGASSPKPRTCSTTASSCTGHFGHSATRGGDTTFAHLSKLLDGELVAVENEGRHRYYRLAGPDVVEALERLAVIKRQQPVRRPVLSPQARKLQFARCCYKHLAGWHAPYS